MQSCGMSRDWLSSGQLLTMSPGIAWAEQNFRINGAAIGKGERGEGCIKVGYQGIAHSNSHDASIRMAAKLFLDDVEFVPLVTAAGVVEALADGRVDMGTLAVRNSVSGIVTETRDALGLIHYEVLITQEIPVHHCLFKREKGIADSAITAVASHVQALRQCENTLRKMLPGAGRQAVEDTAIAARYLREGLLGPHVSALCRMDAGLYYGLELMAENVEDFPNSTTTFQMIRRAKVNGHGFPVTGAQGLPQHISVSGSSLGEAVGHFGFPSASLGFGY